MKLMGVPSGGHSANSKKKSKENGEGEAENLAPIHPTPTKPLRRIVPYENLLVWGKFRGLGWWPGRIADRSELSGPLDTPKDPTHWIKWFGDQKFSETHIDNIAPFHEFRRYFRASTYQRNKNYHDAVDTALGEAARRTGKNFSNESQTLAWAWDDFLPGGYCGFLPDIKPDIAKMEASEPVIEYPKADVDSADDDVIPQSEFLERRNRALRHVRNGVLDMKNICLGCGSQEISVEHPCFEGGLCNVCKIDYAECMYVTDENGDCCYCCICNEGRQIVYCDEADCNKCFCTDCMDGLDGIGRSKMELKKTYWKCYLCRERDEHGLLKRRKNWSDLLEVFAQCCERTVYCKLLPEYHPSTKPKEKIKVLSLFDGISTAIVALKALKFEIEVYYAAEIDQNAICISESHHPEIRHVGDVCEINNKELLDWGPFDLLIGGSACNDLSLVSPAREGLWSEKGSGCLFFEYMRLLNACKIIAVQHGKPFFWLYENVARMDQDSKVTITQFLQTSPVLLNARHVSPANRPRLFWGNLPEMNRPLKPVPGDRLTLQECMEPGRRASCTKLGTVTTNADTVSNKTINGQSVVLTERNQRDVLWTTEIERAFGLPDHYTDKSNMSSSMRRKALGKSSSVPIIKHLFFPLKKFYTARK